MDRKAKDIDILKDFKNALETYNINNHRYNRSKVNQMLSKVRNILNVTKSNKYINIDAPLNIGGQHIVENGNCLDFIFDAPFNLDVTPYIYDAVDTAIGVLSDDEFEYPIKQHENMVSIDTSRKQLKTDSNKIFIVHGHAEAVNQEVARTIEKLGLEAIILREQPNSGKTIIEKFEEYAKDVNFAVILLTADDKMEGEDTFRARQNVIFEMGYFMGALGRSNVMCMLQENVEKPGDIDGVVYTMIDKSGMWKFSLVKELNASGYNVDANKIM